MAETKAGPIEAEFDRDFVDKWIKRQKYVWYCIVILLAFTFTGLLGRGPVAKKTVSTGAAELSVTYERILHYRTPATIEVQLPQQVPQNGNVRLRLEGAITSKAAFQEIIPRPVWAAPLADGIVIDIPVTALSSAGRVMLIQQPSAVGPLNTKIDLEGHSSISFGQFVLP